MIQAVTFWSPSWRSLNLSKRSLNHPKKDTRNCQVLMFFLPRIGKLPILFPSTTPIRITKNLGHTTAGSTISTLLHDRINPKDCQVLSLGDTGFLQFFRVVSWDYGKPRTVCVFFSYENYAGPSWSLDTLIRFKCVGTLRPMMDSPPA